MEKYLPLKNVHAPHDGIGIGIQHVGDLGAVPVFLSISEDLLVPFGNRSVLTFNPYPAVKPMGAYSPTAAHHNNCCDLQDKG